VSFTQACPRSVWSSLFLVGSDSLALNNVLHRPEYGFTIAGPFPWSRVVCGFHLLANRSPSPSLFSLFPPLLADLPPSLQVWIPLYKSASKRPVEAERPWLPRVLVPPFRVPFVFARPLPFPPSLSPSLASENWGGVPVEQYYPPGAFPLHSLTILFFPGRFRFPLPSLFTSQSPPPNNPPPPPTQCVPPNAFHLSTRFSGLFSPPP